MYPSSSSTADHKAQQAMRTPLPKPDDSRDKDISYGQASQTKNSATDNSPLTLTV
jgi:hypothetical protein